MFENDKTTGKLLQGQEASFEPGEEEPRTNWPRILVAKLDRGLGSPEWRDKDRRIEKEEEEAFLVAGLLLTLSAGLAASAAKLSH